MANAIYNSFKRDIMNGSIDLDTDTIKLMLVTSTYVPNIDTHTKRSDITNEVIGTGYTAGGVTLTNKTVTVNNTTDRGVFTVDPINLTTATITARGCVLYKSRGGAWTLWVEIIDNNNLVSIGEPCTINVLAQGTIL